jgi:hypothetical protein
MFLKMFLKATSEYVATPHTRPVDPIARTRPDRCRSRFCARTVGAIQNKLKAGAKPDLLILSTATVVAAEKDGAVLARRDQG